MKIPLIAPFAAVSLFLAACGQKSSQITSSSPRPSAKPSEAVEAPDYSGVAFNSVAEASGEEQTTPTPAASAASGVRPVFKSEAATQAANQYLDSYAAVLNDVSAAPPTRTTDPETGLNNVKSQLQKLGRDSAELANQQREIQRQLTPDERKRLRQYQKNLEHGTQDTD
jgi:hypothetical protein